MNRMLLAAAALTFVIGLGHSVIGEFMVFRHLRRSGLVPTDGGSALREYQVRILWATWHVATVLAWCMAALLLWLANVRLPKGEVVFMLNAVMVTMFASATLVFIGTKARHPAWVGLLGNAGLLSMAQ